MPERGKSIEAGKVPAFRFVDLFAGIGGTRLAFEHAGGECVFTCEWDQAALKTYRTNFRPRHDIHGDISTLRSEMIPDHDVVVAGFPCQPFSLAGVVKKVSLGRKHGFEDISQGERFFDLERIIRERRPRAFVLENVKNLVSHDKGATFRRIRELLENNGGYSVSHRVLDARPFVPQHRERVIIVGIRSDLGITFDFDRIRIEDRYPMLATILHPENGTERPESHYTSYPDGQVNPRYTISDQLWAYFQEYARRQRERGNGFGYGLASRDAHSRTLSARYHKDGAEILIPMDLGNPRRLTPRECARLMGFPDWFEIPVADTPAYRQFGNSVVVPLIQAVAVALVDQLGLSYRQQPLGFGSEYSTLELLDEQVPELTHA